MHHQIGARDLGTGEAGAGTQHQPHHDYGPNEGRHKIKSCRGTS
jgi:hypothetical protein